MSLIEYKTLINIAAGAMPMDFDKAVEAAREASSASIKAGDAYMQRFALANLALGLYAQGDWDGLDTVGETSDAPTLIDETIEAMLALRTLAKGEPWVGKPRHSVHVDDQLILGWRAFLDSIAASIADDADTALHRGMEGVRAIYQETGVWDDVTHLWGPVAELAAAARADDDLAELMGIVEDNASFCPPGLLAQRAYVRGLLAVRDGHDDEVEPLLRDAIERFRAWGATLFVTRAEAILGRWLVAQGRGAEGRTLVDRARDTYEALGAARWLADLDAVPVNR